MSFSNIFTEFVLLPLSDVTVGHSIRKQLNFLNESQWWPEVKLIEYQNDKLSKLIDHAYQNVQYYREVMDEHGLKPNDIETIEDLNKLPVLTKEIFKKNYPDKLTARNWKEYKVLNRSSSGSTGTPIQYLMTREGYSMNKACNLRGWYWMGFRLGDKILKISQNERKTLEKKIQDKLDNTLLFASEYSKGSINQFISIFNKFQPKFLRSYPDPLQFISHILEEKNIKLSGLQAINTTGNILFPEVRNLVEEAFDAELYDSYSCEGGPNFFECPTHKCYHSSMEYGISEILNENLDEVLPGENGRLYTTDLWNYVTPFIRYDSKDIVTKAKNQCSCGRQLLAINKIIGRDNDVIITPNGKYLIAQTFTTYFKYIPSILQFQIYQKEIDQIEIRLKVDNTFSHEIETSIIKYWRDYMGNKMQIRVIVLPEIPLAVSGKRRFLIRNNNIPFMI